MSRLKELRKYVDAEINKIEDHVGSINEGINVGKELLRNI